MNCRAAPAHRVSRARSRLVFGILIAANACAAVPARETKTAPQPTDTAWTSPRTGMVYRFYTGKRYGSDAAFNPVSEVLTEGFDVLGLFGQDKHIFNRGFTADLHNIWR